MLWQVRANDKSQLEISKINSKRDQRKKKILSIEKEVFIFYVCRVLIRIHGYLDKHFELKVLLY